MLPSARHIDFQVVFYCAMMIGEQMLLLHHCHFLQMHNVMLLVTKQLCGVWLFVAALNVDRDTLPLFRDEGRQ